MKVFYSARGRRHWIVCCSLCPISRGSFVGIDKLAQCGVYIRSSFRESKKRLVFFSCLVPLPCGCK